MKAWHRLRQRLHSFDWRMVPLVGLLAVTAAASYGYHRLLIEQREWIEHTYQVLTELDAVLQCVTDAETGQRGYILTGDEAYIKPYRDAVRQLREEPDRLKALVQDSPNQLSRLEELQNALSEKLRELAETLDVSRTGNVNRAKAIVKSNLGRIQMDRIRGMIAVMRRAETDLLLRRSSTALRTQREMLLVTVVLTAISIFVRVMLSFISGRMRPPNNS